MSAAPSESDEHKWENKHDLPEDQRRWRQYCVDESKQRTYRTLAVAGAAATGTHFALDKLATKWYRGFNWRLRLIVGASAVLALSQFRGEKFLTDCREEPYRQWKQWKKY